MSNLLRNAFDINVDTELPSNGSILQMFHEHRSRLISVAALTTPRRWPGKAETRPDPSSLESSFVNLERNREHPARTLGVQDNLSPLPG